MITLVAACALIALVTWLLVTTPKTLTLAEEEASLRRSWREEDRLR